MILYSIDLLCFTLPVIEELNTIYWDISEVLFLLDEVNVSTNLLLKSLIPPVLFWKLYFSLTAFLQSSLIL